MQEITESDPGKEEIHWGKSNFLHVTFLLGVSVHSWDSQDAEKPAEPYAIFCKKEAKSGVQKDQHRKDLSGQDLEMKSDTEMWAGHSVFPLRHFPNKLHKAKD